MKKYALLLFLCFFALPHLVKAAPIQDMNLAALTEFVAQNKGKVVMVNFFATWCPPCKEEIPDLIAISKDKIGKDIAIIGLSVDNDKKAVPAFVEKLGIDYPVFFATDDVISTFGISAIPHNVFYAPNGKIMLAGSGVVDKASLTEIFKKLLEQKK